MDKTVFALRRSPHVLQDPPYIQYIIAEQKHFRRRSVIHSTKCAFLSSGEKLQRNQTRERCRDARQCQSSPPSLWESFQPIWIAEGDTEAQLSCFFKLKNVCLAVGWGKNMGHMLWSKDPCVLPLIYTQMVWIMQPFESFFHPSFINLSPLKSVKASEAPTPTPPPPTGKAFWGLFRSECWLTGMGMEVIEGLRFLAFLPLAITGQTEGGEKTQPFNRLHSLLFTAAAVLYVKDMHLEPLQEEFPFSL